MKIFIFRNYLIINKNFPNSWSKKFPLRIIQKTVKKGLNFYEKKISTYTLKYRLLISCSLIPRYILVVDTLVWLNSCDNNSRAWSEYLFTSHTLRPNVFRIKWLEY